MKMLVVRDDQVIHDDGGIGGGGGGGWLGKMQDLPNGGMTMVVVSDRYDDDDPDNT